VITPLHDPSQPEAAPPQAQPLRSQGCDEDKGEQACGGSEKRDGRMRRVAADGGGGRGEEPRDGVGGGDLERGGAVVELVVEDLGVGAGDLEFA